MTMAKIEFDIDSLIKDMEQSKYKINTTPYAKGCNDVLDYYINKLKKIKGEAMQ